MRDPVVCISELAEDLDVERQTISDIMRKRGIAPKPVPRMKHAKGLDTHDVAVIRGILSISTPEASN